MEGIFKDLIWAVKDKNYNGGNKNIYRLDTTEEMTNESESITKENIQNEKQSQKTNKQTKIQKLKKHEWTMGKLQVPLYIGNRMLKGVQVVGKRETDNIFERNDEQKLSKFDQDYKLIDTKAQLIPRKRNTKQMTPRPIIIKLFIF